MSDSYQVTSSPGSSRTARCCFDGVSDTAGDVYLMSLTRRRFQYQVAKPRKGTVQVTGGGIECRGSINIIQRHLPLWTSRESECRLSVVMFLDDIPSCISGSAKTTGRSIQCLTLHQNDLTFVINPKTNLPADRVSKRTVGDAKQSPRKRQWPE